MCTARSLFLLLSLTLVTSCASGGLGADKKNPDSAGLSSRALLAQQAVVSDSLPKNDGKPTTGRQKLREGDQLRSRGDLPRALLAYYDAATLDPKDTAPSLRIGQVQLETNPAEAAKTFLEAAKKHPGEADAWQGLGLARLGEGRLEEAREALLKAIELDPESAILHSSLGAVCDRLGDFDCSKTQHDRALELAPQDVIVLNNAAVSFLLREEYAQAETRLAQALRLAPKNLVALNNLALALGLQDRYVEALDVFLRTGDQQSAYNNLGYLYYLRGRFEEARGAYEQALLVRGDHEPIVLENLQTLEQAEEQGEKPPLF